MQPTPGDVHVNTPLTNISIAMLQSAGNFIGTRAFPNIPVSKQSDAYYTYDRGYFNRDEMKERAPGTESEGSGYNVDADATYFARVYAFHHDIPDQRRANADSALAPDREATALVTQKALIKREKLFADAYFKGSVWTFERDGVASTPNETSTTLHWSDAASDPIQRVRAAKRTVLENTGFEPNKLVLGKTVYDTLLDHPDIIDRIKYGQTAGAAAMANQETLAKLFEVDEIMVSKAISNTANEGAANAHSFICGKHALLCYAAPAPGLMTPSAGYTFSWNGYMGAGAEGTRIKQFRMENLASDRVEIEMAMTCKLVAADLGFFWENIVA